VTDVANFLNSGQNCVEKASSGAVLLPEKKSMSAAEIHVVVTRVAIHFGDRSTKIHDDEPERDYDRHDQQQCNDIHASHRCRASPRSRLLFFSLGWSAAFRTTSGLSSF
jgi:hypothetical protein